MVQFADAIAARLLLIDASAEDALTHFLSSRKAALQQAASSTGGLPLAQHLFKLAHLLQESLRQAAVLFMEPSVRRPGGVAAWDTHTASQDTEPMIALRFGGAEAFEGAAELLFDALEIQQGKESSLEDAAWRDAVSAAHERAAALGTSTVAPILQQWYAAASAAIAGAFNSAETCEELAQAAERTQENITAWRGPVGGEESAEDGQSWGTLAHAVLGQRIDLWSAAFEPGLRQRAVTLLDFGLSSALRALPAALQPYLTAAASTASAEAGHGNAGGSTWAALAAAATSAPGAVGMPDKSAWRQAIPALEQQLRRTLGSALADAAGLVAASPELARHSTSYGDRSTALQDRARQASATAIAEVADDLQGHVQALDAHDSPGCATDCSHERRCCRRAVSDGTAARLLIAVDLLDLDRCLCRHGVPDEQQPSLCYVGL